MTLAELQQAYFNYLRKQRRSLATVGLNRRWVCGFLDFCARQGLAELAHLTPEVLSAYQMNLQGRMHKSKGRRFAPNSLDQMVHTLRPFFRWAFNQGYLKHDLGQHLCPPRPTNPQT